MKRLSLTVLSALLIVLLLSSSVAQAQGGSTTITILHFSDYHSHGPAFYSEGKFNQGGIARGIGYLRGERIANPNAVILSGGDTMNVGSPSWSDKYLCTEWDWFNGILDAMAFGNHDADYGPAMLQHCAGKIQYPIVSANFVKADTNEAYFQVNGKPYLVIERGGVKLGLFALAGSDFTRLIRPTLLPANTKFIDATPVAREVVRQLREVEKVNAVISFGHRYYEEDIELAKAVPGIDLILGTHSHRKEDLGRIPGTATWFISPYQFLTYVSRVELTFSGGRLINATGRLVRMDTNIPEAPDVKEGVEARQKALETDPFFAPKFVKIGSAAVELSDENLNTGEAVIGNFVMDLFRQKAQAHLAVSTSSSFRASIPPGDITVEGYQAALPFRNIITTVDLPGAVVRELLNFGASKTTTDNFLQQSGARFALRNGQAQGIQILRDPSDPAKGYEVLDDAKTYVVATTDFAANIQADYSKIFAKGTNKRSTGFVVNDVVIEYIRTNSPVAAKLDGRVTTGGVAAPAPAAGGGTGAAGGTYTVQPGDTLSAIADQVYGAASRWRDIYEANKETIGANPGLIVPGQVLKLP